MTEARYSSDIPRGEAIDFLDVVGGYLAACRLCDAGYEEEDIEGANLPMEHLVLHDLAGKGETFSLLAKAVDEAEVTGLGITHLIQSQWLALKAFFVRQGRGQQMGGMAYDIASGFWTDHDLVYSYGVVFADNLNRVSLYRRGNKVLSVSERRFVSTPGELVTRSPTAVIRQAVKQSTPVTKEGGKRDKWRTNLKCITRHGDEACKDAALNDALDVETSALVAGKATIFVSDRAKADGQIQKFEGPFFLDFNRDTCQRLAHLLGPQRFVFDDTPLTAVFDGEGGVSFRRLNGGAA